MLRNGGFSSSPLVGRFCGALIDRLIRSHGNRLYLKFVSDAYGSSRGFKILYDSTASGWSICINKYWFIFSIN